MKFGEMPINYVPARPTGIAPHDPAADEPPICNTSADSMAWSYNARKPGNSPLPGCTHKNCANCMRYALRWRRGALNIQTAMELAA